MTSMSLADVVFACQDLELAGTLHTPDADGLHPVILMMQGSGPSDRDSNGYFTPIREAFVASGVSVFSFDKPGCGASTGDWRDHGFRGRANQARTAMDMLAERPDIDPEKIGLFGQSQGGWLVQMLAAELPGLPFAVASSGPSIGVVEQDLYGCEHQMRAAGHTETDIKKALAFLGELHEAALRDESYESLETRLLRSARTQPWYGYASVDDARDWANGVTMVTESHEPVTALESVRCPFLAVYGGQDVLVPAWRSARESGQALVRAGNGDATVVVFPNADHRLQDTDSGKLLPGYLDLLGSWTARRAAPLPGT